MTQNNQPITTLHDLLDYDARKFTVGGVALKNALLEWINQAESLQLKTLLQKYLDIVQRQLKKMELFLTEEEITSLGISNRLMQAFIEETDKKLSNCTDAAIKDACLLACVQAINHFKISAFGTAAAFANELGMKKHAKAFHEAEVNEKQVDDRLSQLAEYETNIKARAAILLTDNK